MKKPISSAFAESPTPDSDGPNRGDSLRGASVLGRRISDGEAVENSLDREVAALVVDGSATGAGYDVEVRAFFVADVVKVHVPGTLDPRQAPRIRAECAALLSES